MQLELRSLRELPKNSTSRQRDSTNKSFLMADLPDGFGRRCAADANLFD
jgi:hypothetical protein